MKVEKKKDQKKKKKDNWLEAQIMIILQRSLKAALDQALDEIMKEWK